MEGFAFQQGGGHLAESNVAVFMKKHGISSYQELVKKANNDIAWYWDAVNDDLGLEWFHKYDSVYDSSSGVPWTRWFLGGKCNIVGNAIDRHARKSPDKVAYIFASERGSKNVTYGQLDAEVGRLASAMKGAGVRKGDVVGIYLPTIAEAFYAIFACSRIGAVHATVFSGFGAQALHSRLLDSKAKMLVTADTARRRGKDVDLKSQWSSAVEGTDVSTIVTVNGQGDGNNIASYADFVNGAGSANTEAMDAEDPLFILYTSGTTGRPKGTLQVHGGFAAVAGQQAKYLVDMRPDDVLFWHADIGWITGQVWVVYGSPIVGGTALVYEDALDYPAPDAWCRLIKEHKVSIFGAAPTAIRMFMKGDVPTAKYDFSSLRVLACTGEPINREAWNWYFEKVGQKRCPVINVSGGTEAGGAIVGAAPAMSLKPCTVGCPVPGFDADIFDESGRPASEGYLVIKKPWPSMSRGILNDPSRFIETYWSKYKDVWYHGDIVSVDGDGLWYMRGRADDVIKVSGHRIGTAEVEAAVASHPAVAEAVAVGRPDELRGEAIVVCAVVRDGQARDERLKAEIAARVEGAIGRFARPQEVRLVAELPKTRTGKFVRRLVKAKIAGESMAGQDLSMVENPSSLDGI
ncbi:MAG: AMP-binding protein [Nitrososphaera sp.]|uniref:AMP-binding protein n=1 Tax=Nitrososphaera sp. TaxID=1971748 RepID=UPI003D6DCBEE